MIEINTDPAFDQTTYDSEGKRHWYCRRCDHLVDASRADILIKQAQLEKIRSAMRLIVTIVTAAIIGSIATECTKPPIDTWGSVIVFAFYWLLGCVCFAMFAIMPAYFACEALEWCALHTWARFIRPRPSGG
ncbi:MAG: hypothetical protein ACREF0_01380 [Acetobacteraceae bacterium]